MNSIAATQNSFDRALGFLQSGAPVPTPSSQTFFKVFQQRELQVELQL